ncbi:MAG TPA: TonB-dependent receptor plug domain-containing protein [Gemmatimonadaceae bacterium]
MNRTTRFARSPLSARFACVAVAVIVGVAGCGHPKADPGPSPLGTATSSTREVKTTATMPTNMSIEEYLASRSSGVEIGHANGNVTVRLRGASGMYGNTQPLYIVDGVPFTPTTDGGLSGINPYDVASIRALRDAADIAQYGVRGANGVIIIKTKKANQ